MSRRARISLAALLLSFGLVAQARAFPPFPPYQCPWHEAPECPRRSYCCLHYLIPALYTYRAYHSPPHYVFCFPPESALIGYRVDSYACRATTSAEQAAKYANFGRRFDDPADVTRRPTVVRPPARKATGKSSEG
jgi:hypothetical protein